MYKKDAPKDDMKTRLEFIVLENLRVHLKKNHEQTKETSDIWICNDKIM